jgi:putative ABC transport system ATP-binding protein
MSKPVIQLDHVTRVYGEGDSAVHALRGVNLTVRAGELVAIMGTSGSGKSTMLNILGCLDVPTGGHYVLDGVAVETMSRSQLADLRNAKLGFVFQGFNLLARTSAIENVELPLLYRRGTPVKNTREVAIAALERVGLGKRLDHHPSMLSGGQQQRVAIARALVTEPTVLLADEPTGNLDSRTGGEILLFMRSAVDLLGQTIVMVTHDAAAASHADTVLFLADGQIVDSMASPSADRILDRLKAFGG